MSLSVNSTTVSKIYKSRKIILDILEERGFDVSDHGGFSTNHIHTLFINKQLDMLLENPETKQKLYVKYNLAKNGGFGKLKPQDIQDFIDDAYDVEELLNEGDEFIIVTKDNFNELSSESTLKESLGHTKLEVLVGSILGPIVALPGIFFIGSPLHILQMIGLVSV